MYENSPLIWPAEPGQCLGIDSAIFTASDKDAASDLTIGIDWKESKGYSRDNQRVSNTTLYEDTFVMSQKKMKQSVTGTLEISSEKFIDYESVARLELTLFVEDKVSIFILIVNMDKTSMLIFTYQVDVLIK